MTLIATENLRFSNVIKYEHKPEKGYCRESAVVNEGSEKSYLVGTVLGKTITGGTATATAGSGNTGDGTMGAITVTAPAKVGLYKLVVTAAATNAGTFIVTDPDGLLVGAGTVAAAFSAGGLAFTLADGAADFVVGDSFDIRVTGSYKYKVSVETATDGSQFPCAIALEEKTIAATTDTTTVVMVRGPAGVSKEALTLDATWNNDAKKTRLYNALEALGIAMHDQL